MIRPTDPCAHVVTLLQEGKRIYYPIDDWTKISNLVQEKLNKLGLQLKVEMELLDGEQEDDPTEIMAISAARID